MKSITPASLTALGIHHAMDRHPDLPGIDVEELLGMGAAPEEVLSHLRARHEIIARQWADPLRNGWESPGFKRARKAIADMRARVPDGVVRLLIQGGNRTGKSEFCAKLACETLTGGPGRQAWCFQQTEAISRKTQQAYVFRYLPPEWKPQGEARNLKRTQSTNVSYTAATGFSNNQFVLPNRSGCEFKFYDADLKAMQGSELDLLWFDELVPQDWIEDLRFRLVTRAGLMLVSFTALDGFTDVVADFVEGSQRVEEVEAELLPVRGPDGKLTGYEKMPLVLACQSPAKRVVYFPTHENLYGNPESMKQELAGASPEVIRVRAYGYTEKRFGAALQFYPHNILTDEQAKHILTNAKDYTWTHLMDPAGTGAARNPFMQWWATSRNGQHFLMREWPQPEDYIPGIGDASGVWAEKGGTNGKPGPGQKWFGFGLEDVCREIGRVETELASQCAGLGRIDVRLRLMDSRAGNSTTMTSGGAITLIDQYWALSKDVRLWFEPTSGRQKAQTGETWKIMVQMKLELRKDLQAPEIMVAPWCGNSIFGLTTYTENRADGKVMQNPDGACKDPVDCVKYFTLEDVRWAETRTDGKASSVIEWGGPSRARAA